MKILVTGTDGYLGSLLAPKLAEKHEITGVDTGFYREGWLFHPPGKNLPATLTRDIRLLQAEDLQGFDAVVHMAELSNDPAGELAPEITYKINHEASTRLARMARKAGVRRFVYMSSCSVYGVGGEDVKTEESPVNPQTAYAICKTLVEQDLAALATDDFSTTCLRNATAYGASPRMRFDIVLNNLCGLAWTTREIKMISDGTPWRPLVHGLDIARAIECVLEAPQEKIHSQIFNVGDTDHNYRVREIAEMIAGVFPGCQLSFGGQPSDNRSYRVSFDKIRQALPDFSCAWNAEKGARQLHAIFSRIDLTAERFAFRAFTRLKALEHLLRTGQIDREFFWQDPELLPA